MNLNEYQIVKSKVNNPPLELYVKKDSFYPNPTTVRFARAIDITAGDIVYDIGTGVGPLAIMSAMKKAYEVHGVDPVKEHCELARENIKKYNLDKIVSIYHGEYFDPIDENPDIKCKEADVIIGDVSGIADQISKALGWYSNQVPTGGDDGSNIISEFLNRAPNYLRPNGSVYFPVAVDLSNSDRIYESATRNFKNVENTGIKEYIEFPLTDEQIEQINMAYNGDIPDYITIQEKSNGKKFWRGQVLKASL